MILALNSSTCFDEDIRGKSDQGKTGEKKVMIEKSREEKMMIKKRREEEDDREE